MRTKLKTTIGALALSPTLPALAETAAICVWKVEDGVRKCVPVDMPGVIIVDPDWLVAIGAAFLMLAIASIYFAIRFNRLIDQIKAPGRIG